MRVAIDWTIEGTQHLLVASLILGRRAVPLSWKAYQECELKARRSEYEREFIRTLLVEVLSGVARGRLIITADRGLLATLKHGRGCSPSSPLPCW